MQRCVLISIHRVQTSVSDLIDAEQSFFVSALVIKPSMTRALCVCACVCGTLRFIKIVLPPWPAEVLAVCVDTEEKFGACWWPLHCVSSTPTGNQTKTEKIRGCSITLVDFYTKRSQSGFFASQSFCKWFLQSKAPGLKSKSQNKKKMTKFICDI